jgi:hypothetical protein
VKSAEVTFLALRMYTRPFEINLYNTFLCPFKCDAVHNNLYILDSSLIYSLQLKLLKVVVKNLSDLSKNSDPKYRQLRLSNEKVKAKLLPCPSAVEYLQSLGLKQVEDDEDGATYLRLDSSFKVDESAMKEALSDVSKAIDTLTTTATVSGNGVLRLGGSGETRTPDGILIRSGSNVSTASSSSRMSEKQKSRLLMEEKRKKDAIAAKEARARTSALIKKDKYVRENDENWKSGQSAACVKSGNGISTFRDKYGEN